MATLHLYFTSKNSIFQNFTHKYRKLNYIQILFGAFHFSLSFSSLFYMDLVGMIWTQISATYLNFYDFMLSSKWVRVLGDFWLSTFLWFLKKAKLENLEWDLKSLRNLKWDHKLGSSIFKFSRKVKSIKPQVV